MKFAIVIVSVLVCAFLVGCGAVPKQPSSGPSASLPATPSAPGSVTPTPPPPSSSSSSSPGVTTTCPAGQYDMLDWATLDPDLASGYHLEGNANPLYTVVEKDKFYWLKSATGYPWDIQLTDSNNMYLWVTEQSWSDPYSFKKSHKNTNMPLTPRCATPGQPGTAVKSTDTSFEIVAGCKTQQVSNLGTMLNEIWGPNKMNHGGDIPDNTNTITISYRYNCAPGEQQCQDREEYFLTQRYGLVRWDHAKLHGGQYVVDQYTVYNKLVAGGPPTPVFPCGG